MASRNRKIATATIFGGIAFVATAFLPSPLSDFLIIIPSFFFALGYIVLGRGGATYVSLVDGLLTTPFKLSFAPFSLIFALILGILIDLFATAFKARRNSEVRTSMLTLSTTLGTAITGLAAYYITVKVTGLLNTDFSVALTILVFGIISGAAAGFLAAKIWNRNLRSTFESEIAAN
jgi:ABC-type thiamin/hydroxymethylpyrimidine transport system permease subunit